MSNAREDILGRLRTALEGKDAWFPRSEAPRPGPAITAPEAGGDRLELAKRFGNSLVAVSGSYEIVDPAAGVAGRIVEIVKAWSAEDPPSDEGGSRRRNLEVLSWASAALTPPDLEPPLGQAGIKLVVPEDLHDRHSRYRAASIRIGLTAVDAAIATTGSVVLVAGRGKSRAASLLPTHHLMIVAASRIYPTLEDWCTELRREGLHAERLKEPGQIVLVTGPSKSADIELNLTLGVHGPRVVHAIVYDDAER